MVNQQIWKQLSYKRIWYPDIGYLSQRAVVLIRATFCNPGDFWQYLGTFWIVTADQKKCNRHIVCRSHGCCSKSYNVQDSSPKQQKMIWPIFSKIKMLRNLDLEGYFIDEAIIKWCWDKHDLLWVCYLSIVCAIFFTTSFWWSFCCLRTLL